MLTACGSSQNEAQEQVQTQIEKNRHDSAGAQTREVIFFAPSSSELDSMLSAPGGDSFNEVIADYDFYVSEFMSDPGRSDLKIRYISDKVISIPTSEGTLSITRDEGQSFGVILTDHRRQPLVNRGVFVTVEYRQMCKDYFGEPGK